MNDTCSHCRKDLPAFISHELGPRRRARVARHLSTCRACEAVYRRERDMARELRATLPAIGTPNRAQLGSLWQNVQADLRAGRAHASFRPYRVRYGVAVVVLVMALWLPWAFYHGQARAVPVPPTPNTTVGATASPNSTADTLLVAAFSTPAFAPNDAPTALSTLAETP